MTAPTTKSFSGRSGMTLLEMMVSVSILVLIIFGLTAAFNQTQRIFVTGLSQTDTLEGGRAALDLIRRDLEPAAGWQNASSNTVVAAIGIEQGPYPMVQVSGGVTVNVLEKVFLLRQLLTGAVVPATNFTGVGYRVLNTYTNSPNNGAAEINTAPPLVGALYRFSSANVTLPPPIGALLPPNLPAFVFGNGVGTGYLPSSQIAEGYLTLVLDGVVHFQVNFYDQNGNLMAYPAPFPQYVPATPQNIEINGGFFVPNYFAPATNGPPPPAFLEIELGVMDPSVLNQFKALFPGGDDGVPGPLNGMGVGLILPTGGGGGAATGGSPQQKRANFIYSHAGNIHYFRTQIPVRTSLTIPQP